ncbi:MAG TPA: 3,4-dehydroadipyl-CoA semialdehyde dehydrogenase [Thermoanaerobaculia bacterium]|jgi:oxepin-CoA hydrolase/3-oxo-5,6-dehydrosuberyl-CoA semialdehyde dehydrogenase|nr:3,4-dehydroadipyl-CoA semialdehyde dehydrogenase [Thermoanaerobaculia bacterium]
MKTLRSYVRGSWHEATSAFVTLVDPSTEEEIARASSAGIDFGAVLDYAREHGGPALRTMTFSQRAGILKDMSRVLRDHRDELLDLSARNTGTTRPDGSFDVDGGSGTLAYYFSLGRGLGDRTFLSEGEGVQLAKTEGFYGRHILVPRHGVAVHINAFNFPVWGFAEKAACALLAGMPVVIKPATATAMVTERAIELIVEAGILPDGALQLIIGSTGDLLDRLGPQDVLAFTGSADTARSLRSRENLLAANTRVNVEADSLNAAILGPDVEEGSATFGLFLKDVVREMTQKSGQKCTAVRRILVPAARVEGVREALVSRLSEVVVGNPADPAVKMGPLATAQQLEDTLRGIGELQETARIVHGTGQRADGAGAPTGKGYFLQPTLLETADSYNAGPVHSREVFAPVATLLSYDGTAASAAEIVALGGGTLVTSAYTDDAAWAGEFVARGGGETGRIYIGSESSAADALGSGAALPQTLHGGPGRAGGGEELGGLVGVKLYLQRVAVQGSKILVDELVGA